MVEYEVSVDFHDNSITVPPKKFTNLSDLSLYLERIPGLIGMDMTGRATIEIKTVTTNPLQDKLLDLSA